MQSDHLLMNMLCKTALKQWLHHRQGLPKSLYYGDCYTIPCGAVAHDIP